MNKSPTNPNQDSATPKLVLGSSSPFRRELLARLGVPFVTESPDINEDALASETPEDLVLRLAEEKARAAGQNHPDSLVIGSDQVACLDGSILGKPGNRENAIAQLHQSAGKRLTFYTGLCLLNTASNEEQIACESFHVHFRQLSNEQIERYVDREQPFNCAGSFKSEGLGIALFDRLEGDDPNALIGLPLIRLIDMLAEEGVEIP
jgi:MAF protein